MSTILEPTLSKLIAARNQPATTTQISYPPLTTTFTPPAGCLSYRALCFITGYESETPGLSCDGRALLLSVCGNTDPSLNDSREYTDCFPVTTTEILSVARDVDKATQFGTRIHGVSTYSPGLACPLGMTTATSMDKEDAVFCCPSGLTLSGDLNNNYCEATLTDATLTIRPGDDCVPQSTVLTFGPDLSGTYSIDDGLVYQNSSAYVYAPAIVLLGRQAAGLTSTPTGSSGDEELLSQLSFIKTSVLSNTSSIGGNTLSPSPVTERSGGLSQGALLAIVVSFSVVVLIIIGVVFFFLIRRRGRRRRKQATLAGPDSDNGGVVTQVSGEGDTMYGGKPELEGSLRTYVAKTELDAVATVRAELEGSLRDEGGAGIYVLKPELQGTPGDLDVGAGQVYVKKKSELDAGVQRVKVNNQLEKMSLAFLTNTNSR